MDFEAFTTSHRDEWERLKVLSKRRSLTGEEADELVLLYQIVSSHLSVVRSTAPDPTLISDLSLMLSTARTRITGSRDTNWRGVVTLFTESMPAALYRSRWWTHGVTAGFFIIAAVMAVWVATTPEGLERLGSVQERDAYVNQAFAEYYEPGGEFAAMVWTNNAWIAVQCVAFGVTGIWPIFVMASNAVNVGMIAGLMAAYGELGLFLQLISPHGLLELTSIFVAGGAGLKLFWALVNPGRRPRSVALAQEGRSLMLVAGALVFALGLSGIIEGFVTGSTMLWWVKIVIGAIALAAFWTYVYTLGRAAVRRGATGDLSEEEAGYYQQYA
ncbi:stage II sporulation protein M [Jonesia quinghaiensis]|uniref:stage II sporulation protein M n=1 Tax=Jonesia quinghaiensis TaxID=262806 RepID=UPI00048FA289|nr:stage II sporulation protein M [Jonesia quinghaiensis]